MQLSMQYINSIWHFGLILVDPPNQQNILQYLVTGFEMTILCGFTANSFTPNRCRQLNYNLKPHHRNKNRNERTQAGAGSNESQRNVCNHTKDQACMHVFLEYIYSLCIQWHRFVYTPINTIKYIKTMQIQLSSKMCTVLSVSSHLLLLLLQTVFV